MWVYKKNYYSKKFGGKNKEWFQGLGGVHWFHSINELIDWKVVKDYPTWNLAWVATVFSTLKCKNQSNANEYGEGYCWSDKDHGLSICKKE